MSDDGRWLFVFSGSGTTNNRLWVADLKDPKRPDVGAPLVPLTTAEDAVNSPLGVVHDSVYIYTNWQAPKGRIVVASVRVGVHGVPDLELEIKGGVHGDRATAAMVVNAIPRVVSARPGVLTMDDISVSFH